MNEGAQLLSVDPAQARARGAVDINFFAGLCLPDVMVYPFPPYYVALFGFLVNSISREQLYRVLRFAIGLPRGFAKTTFLKVIVAWLICYDKFSFVVIVCATESHGENFIADVHGILQSPNIIALYGDWDKRSIIDNKGVKKSIFRNRSVILQGIGAGTAIRGISMDNRRPDFILCDDMQTKENDDSDADSVKLIDWAVGTLFKIVSPSQSVICYVGNMYSQRCLLYKLKEHPDWLSLITGCILESGESLWPELHPLYVLYESFKHDESLGKADTWFAEMMNDPVTRQNALLNGPLPITRYDGVVEPDAAFLTIDPAGFRSGADDNVITGHTVVNKKWHVALMDGGKFDPGALIKNSLKMAVELNANLIGVEDVAYQQTLIYWFDRVFVENHVTGIQVVPLKVSGASKEKRIRTFIQEMYAGEYSFLRDMDKMKFTWQAAAYRSGKTNNKDDWLDSPAMGLLIRNQHRHLLGIRKSKDSQEPKPGVVTDNTPF